MNWVESLPVPVITAKLAVYPDSTTPGSEGRLCLQLPKELTDELGGNCYHVRGRLGTDNAILLVHDSLIPSDGHDSKCVTPRMQIWWKNGVRDHGIRENWWTKVYLLDRACLVVMLDKVTGEPKPVLPPRQETVFG